MKKCQNIPILNKYLVIYQQILLKYKQMGENQQNVYFSVSPESNEWYITVIRVFCVCNNSILVSYIHTCRHEETTKQKMGSGFELT